MNPGDLFLSLLLLALNGYFAAAEAALAAPWQPRPVLRQAQEPLPADIEADTPLPALHPDLIAKLQQVYTAARLGWLLSGLMLGVFAVDRLSRWLTAVFERFVSTPDPDFIHSYLPALTLLAALMLIAGPLMLLVNLAARAAVRQYPQNFLNANVAVLLTFTALSRWVTAPAAWAAGQIVRGADFSPDIEPEFEDNRLAPLPPGPPDPEPSPISGDELEKSSHVIDFGSLIVRQISVPRTEIVAIEAGCSIQDALALAMESGVTKLPLYENSLDQIVGIVHLRDLVHAMQNGQSAQLPARDLAREALFMPETSSVNDLLHQFRARHAHMAIVVEEYGGTYGLVTLEDALEEIVGDVQDPFETTPPPIQAQPDGSSLIDGMVLLEEVNDYFQLRLIDPDYDTIAGFILGKLGRIPQAGDTVEDAANSVRLRVGKMDHLRIAQVYLTHI